MKVTTRDGPLSSDLKQTLDIRLLIHSYFYHNVTFLSSKHHIIDFRARPRGVSSAHPGHWSRVFRIIVCVQLGPGIIKTSVRGLRQRCCEAVRRPSAKNCTGLLRGYFIYASINYLADTRPIRHSMLCNGATIHKIMGGAERDKSGAFCHILSMFSFQSDRGLETLMLDTIIEFMEKHFDLVKMDRGAEL